MVFDFFVKYLFSSRAGALVKTISWLSLIGLTVSISALVVVISVMTALNHNIEDRTLAVQPHLTVLIPGINSGALLELHPLVAKLKQNPDLRVSVFEQQDLILRTLDGRFRRENVHPRFLRSHPVVQKR
jgi:lipoprotein-releasing system permease protein